MMALSNPKKSQEIAPVSMDGLLGKILTGNQSDFPMKIFPTKPIH